LTLYLFNSYGRKLLKFEPIVEGEVRMYTCGPTVWNYAHIGNFRTFVFEDILKRYLQFKGYKVIHVRNITDVEDKIIDGMKKSGKSLKELTEFYEKAFTEDLAMLNIQKADHHPRATEHIDEMIKLVSILIRKKIAYKGEDGSIYYDVDKFKRYGKLSGIKIDELKAGARVSQDHYEKKEARDFALWKAWDKEDESVFWEKEFGKGRPGWHIECSAMSMKYLGNSFDIHTGGKDLKFPHHENEIAQSEAATGKRFARYWLHSEFLMINGEEMHKSLGNIITLRDLIEKGWSPRAIRLFLITAHYREELNLTDESLKQAESTISKIDQFIRRLALAKGVRKRSSKNIVEQLLKDFTKAMDEDLNTPKALAAFFRFIRKVNILLDNESLSEEDSRSILEVLKRVNNVLGVMRLEQEKLDERFLELIHEREEARTKHDFRRADEIREILRKNGIILEDTPKGTVWSKAN
jgi:cysteinyl-tRNA synthetase